MKEENIQVISAVQKSSFETGDVVLSPTEFYLIYVSCVLAAHVVCNFSSTLIIIIIIIKLIVLLCDDKYTLVMNTDPHAHTYTRIVNLLLLKFL